jgi:hypothetical protein
VNNRSTAYSGTSPREPAAWVSNSISTQETEPVKFSVKLSISRPFGYKKALEYASL